MNPRRQPVNPVDKIRAPPFHNGYDLVARFLEGFDKWLSGSHTKAATGAKGSAEIPNLSRSAQRPGNIGHLLSFFQGGQLRGAGAQDEEDYIHCALLLIPVGLHHRYPLPPFIRSNYDKLAWASTLSDHGGLKSHKEHIGR
jgi:hypothetical protein